MTQFSREELIQRAFYRVATVMHGMWQEKGSSDTRLLLPPLIPDEFVEAGFSVKGADRKEHVVPRAVICEECHKMFKAGRTTEEVANFIRQHLKIVHISSEEQVLLDSGKGLNLRQRMPDGWTFWSDDLYARLSAGSIQIRFYDVP